MQFKKVDVLISENLTKEQLKEKVLTELNKISKESNPSISYIANIHDIVNGKYWICMDSETKETMEAADELIDLQAIFRHTTENPEEASKDLLYSSKYIEDNFLRKIIFETYKEANDSRLTKLETTVGTNEKDIEDKHYKLERRVTTAENTITTNKELEDTRYSEYTQFKKNIENNILGINNNLNTKANLGGSETQVFNVADPTSDWHAINLAYAKKNFNVDLINTHKTDFNNPHKTSIANLIDASIVDPTNNHILQYDSNTKKWKNAVLSVDLSNYYNKSEVDSKLDTKANTSNVYNKSEINTKFNSYYNKSTIDSFMELKASAESVYDKSEIDTKLQDVLTQADNRYSTLLTQNLEWTVGSGKETDTHFNTLEKAIIESSKYRPANGYNFISITLKTGWVWDKPISIPTGSDLSFVKIFSESENECVVNNVFLRGSECTTPYIGVKLNCSQKDAKIQFSSSKIKFLNVIKIDNIRRIDFNVCELEIDGGEINFINNDEDPATFVFERCFGYIFSRIKIDYDYTAKDVFGFLIHNSSGKILMNADLSININATSNSNISGFGFSRTTLDIDAGDNSTTNFTTNCLGVLYSLVFGTILNTHQKIVMNGSEKNIVFLIDKGFNVANIYDPEKITLNQSRYTNITPGQLSNTGQFITPK
ncbi:hypothetical protein [Campylobacter jejuni]|uniref:hypothetical protein n=1 Tax=Campylobacter jejuni TaxID=197 RepID=UPI001876E380|nr:hypothetical protein [Campylobacter jejuni]